GTDAGGTGGAVVRLLEPERYRGMLHFTLDVKGATIYVNGSKTLLPPSREVALPVGTQAVRVTHPEYHDFVRFIDVGYGKTTEVAVGMTQYPIIRRDLAGKPMNRDDISYVDPPLWRRWYVVVPAAVGLAIVSGIIAGYLAHDLPDGQCRKVGGEPC
nr:PEGA domain-containing protein [Deltaproteobacteria bacterium]